MSEKIRMAVDQLAAVSATFAVSRKFPATVTVFPGVNIVEPPVIEVMAGGGWQPVTNTEAIFAADRNQLTLWGHGTYRINKPVTTNGTGVSVEQGG